MGTMFESAKGAAGEKRCDLKRCISEKHAEAETPMSRELWSRVMFLDCDDSAT